MGEFTAILLVAFLVLYCASQVRSNESDHRYYPKDPVLLYANKFGPYHNPSETYAYYDLPFCSSDNVKEKNQSLGEMLNGDRLVSAPYKLDFLVEKQSEVACTKRLKREEVSQFRVAVAHNFYFEMYYDDLPFWSFLGEVYKIYKAKPYDYKYLLYTHIWFVIYYNEDRIIKIIAQTDPNFTVDLTEDKEVDMELVYDVKWMQTNISFERRMDSYYDSSLLPKHMGIHWFSVMNSCWTVLLLLAVLVKVYVRGIKKDINKYANDEELGENQEETGWKSIHGDVFRYPKHKSLLAAAIGSGTQLVILMLFVIILGLLGVYHPYNRGALLTAVVVVYAITSGIAGYTAVSIYCQLEGTNWVRNLLLTGSVFVAPLFITFCFLNTVAMTYRVTAALQLRTILVLLCIWFFVALPLLLLGGIFGKYTASGFQAPCRTTKCPREVPPQRWYSRVLFRMALGGTLSFCVFHTELYYLFAAIWGHRIYTIYLFLLIVAILLFIVTAFVSVIFTYSQLAAEDHEWWWRPFLYGGSTGLNMFGFCVYYYYVKSDMSGFMQTTIFFGYMACVCYGLSLMLGTVGFYASLLFVRHIYASIKCE